MTPTSLSNLKPYIALRYYLLGSKNHIALQAMEFGAKYHTGLRKDGVTPEFFHQIGIANYLRTLLNHLDFPQETVAAAFLHDVHEDYQVSIEDLTFAFGSDISEAVRLLSKVRLNSQGVATKVSPKDYYTEMASNPIASLVKGADRINNQGSMLGAFNTEKQKEYIEETKEHILPMLKTARRTFTYQDGAYENIKFVLGSQIEMIEAIHKGSAS